MDGHILERRHMRERLRIFPSTLHWSCSSRKARGSDDSFSVWTLHPLPGHGELATLRCAARRTPWRAKSLKVPERLQRWKRPYMVPRLRALGTDCQCGNVAHLIRNFGDSRGEPLTVFIVPRCTSTVNRSFLLARRGVVSGDAP